MKKETARDYPKAVSTIHAGTEVIALSGNRCKSYSDKDDAASNDPRNNSEKALGRNDTKRKNIMKKIKENSTIKCLTSERQCAWQPFESDMNDNKLMPNNRHGDIITHLCNMVENSVFEGASQFWDIICPSVANDISERFENYCILSIDTETEQFFRSFYSLNDNDKTLLDAASKTLFNALLRGFKKEIKKTKSTMIRSFNAWTYSTFRSQPVEVANWISRLPLGLQCDAQYGPSFLLEIICDIFCKIIFKAIHDLSCSLRRMNMKNTTMILHPMVDCDSNDGSNIIDGFMNKCEKETTEVQNFFGYAINELISETRTNAKQEKLENLHHDNNMPTELDHCYRLAKSLRVLHQDAAKDHEYLQYFYPVFVASANKGGLCLVAKHIFPFGKELLCNIRSYVTPDKLSCGDRNTVKDAYEKLMDDENLYNLFLDCISKGYCDGFISTIWKKIGNDL